MAYLQLFIFIIFYEINVNLFKICVSPSILKKCCLTHTIIQNRKTVENEQKKKRMFPPNPRYDQFSWDVLNLTI